MILIKKIKLKTFHCEILNDQERLNREAELYKDLPIVRNTSNELIITNYFTIKIDIEDLIYREIEILLNTPGA
jgi:hypothetical protein